MHLINKKKVYFDKNIFIKNYGSKSIIYSDKLQKMMLSNTSFSEQLKEFNNNVNFGERIKFEANNSFIDLLVKNKLIYFNKKEYKLRCKKVEKSIFNKKNSNKIEYFYLHLTQKCNLQCEYCYNKENLNKTNDLSFDKWIEIIDKLKLDSYSNVILTGGEVFLRKDLKNIVKYLKKYNCKIEILSNGTLLDNNIDILKYIDRLVISLDSINQEYDIRKYSNNYNIINNLKLIPNEYKSKVIVRTVLTKYNENEIENIKNFVENELMMKHIISDLVPSNFSDFSLMSSKYLDYSNCNVNSIFYSICTACKKTIAIDSNADIYPCQTLIKKNLKIGNALQDNIYKKIFKSTISKKFKKINVNHIKKCKKCTFKFICGGGCRAIANNLYGNFHNCNIDMCSKYKKVIENNLKKIAGINDER